jgi:LmbE family N-acetylglucosaminyl deacetylase
MNPYLSFVSDVANLVSHARSIPLGNRPPAPRPPLPPGAPKALFFAPHPDDECIAGGPALRLLREAGMDVYDVALTLGSKKERQPGRLLELQNACRYLGFGLLTTAPSGLERINPKTREQDPAHWADCVKVIAAIIETHRPRVVLCPHERDWNTTHIGTHLLVMDALRLLGPAFECHVIETEFWGQMDDPNLMVEISAGDLADLITATSFHIEEVARNPYHLLLPAWMMDNLRRGSELVGGQGGQAPDFTFAVLCRLRRWSRGYLTKPFDGGKLLPRSADLRGLLALGEKPV